MAMESPRVTAEVIEAAEFPDLAQAYQVMAVPRTVINDAVVFDGALPENLFLDAILQSAGKPALADQGGGPVVEEVDTGDQGGQLESTSPL
ncbi:MAG: thioredoxin family protein [Chloroflexi bacterium]|nr:thioredoxin family protein [Chloroflexota bacterium]